MHVAPEPPLDGSELESFHTNVRNQLFATLPANLDLQLQGCIQCLSSRLKPKEASEGCKQANSASLARVSLPRHACHWLGKMTKCSPGLHSVSWLQDATGLALAHLPALIHVRLKEGLELLPAFLEAQVAVGSISKTWMKR